MKLPYYGRGVWESVVKNAINNLDLQEVLIAIFHGSQEYDSHDYVQSTHATEFLIFTNKRIIHTVSKIFKQASWEKPWKSITGVGEIMGVFRGAITIQFDGFKRLRFGEMAKDDIAVAKEIVRMGMNSSLPGQKNSPPPPQVPPPINEEKLLQNDVAADIKIIKENAEELFEMYTGILGFLPDELEEFLKIDEFQILTPRTIELLGYLEKELETVRAAEVRLVSQLIDHCLKIGVKSAVIDFRERRAKIHRKISRFVGEADIKIKKDLVMEDPELYSDLGLHALNMLIIGASLHKEFQDQYEYTRHIILLIKCRQFGPDRTFTEIQDGLDDYWNV
jgi:hypothetical protein